MHKIHLYSFILVAIGSHTAWVQEHSAQGSFLHDDAGMRSLRTSSGAEFDKRFISQTLEHHRGSIELSQKALKIAMPIELKKRARTIISRSNREIGVLRSLLSSWYKLAPLAREQKIVRTDMAERMASKILTSKDYIHQMVSHEQEEVQMGQLVAGRAFHRQLVEVAGAMVSHSRGDIQFFIDHLHGDEK